MASDQGKSTFATLRFKKRRQRAIFPARYSPLGVWRPVDGACSSGARELTARLYCCSTGAAKKNDGRQVLPMCMNLHTG